MYKPMCDYYIENDDVIECLKKGLILPSACDNCKEWEMVKEVNDCVSEDYK